MGAKSSITGRPPWHIVCWCDSAHIYVEIPSKDGPPYIEKHALTEGGLTKALSLMKGLFAEHSPKGGYYVIPELKIKKIGQGVKASEDARERTRAILRDRGLI